MSKAWRSNRPPPGEGWIWHLHEMRGTLTFRALGIHARRVLDFLEHEHMQHGGRENGHLGASYNQLEAWGVARDDIRKGIEELLACGFIRRTAHGLRQAGGGDPSRFALTWLPTGLDSTQPAPATSDWQAIAVKVARSGVTDVRGTRAWLSEVVRPSSRGTAEAKARARSPSRTPALTG